MLRGIDLEEDIKELEPVTTENRDNDKSSLGSKIQGICFKKEVIHRTIKKAKNMLPINLQKFLSRVRCCLMK